MDESPCRAAERALWAQVGLDPVEHRIRLPRNEVDVRVVEIGTGPPVLFLRGGPGAAGPIWSDLAARLPEWRCLLVDRPGTGLSDPHPIHGTADVRREAETMVADVLDGLGIDRAHLVASSHGSYVAVHAAATHPDRIERTVHLGCPGFVEGMNLTAFDRLVTLQQHTDTMRNELATMGTMGSFRRGFDPDLTLQAPLLEQVHSPTYVLWGERDPYGDADVARRFVDALPDAELEMLPGAGHLCWLDDADHAAAAIRRHLGSS